MIKASAVGKDGMTVLVMGITEENIERLKQGRPMAVAPMDFGCAAVTRADRMKISILYGRTHRDIVDQFAEAGIRMPDGAREEALAIDRQLEHERAAADEGEPV